jgi:molecular chaperone GrpE
VSTHKDAQRFYTFPLVDKIRHGNIFLKYETPEIVTHSGRWNNENKMHIFFLQLSFFFAFFHQLFYQYLKMFSSITTRYQTVVKSRVPITLFNNSSRRSFLSSSFVGNDKKDANKEGDKKQEQEEAPTAAGQEEAPTEAGQEETTAPTFEEELKAMSIKFKEVQVKYFLTSLFDDLYLHFNKSNYLLSLADAENLRQRHMKEIANAKDFAIQKFAKDLLDSVDILDIALNSVPEEFRKRETCVEQDPKMITEQLVNLYLGVSMTETELQKTLKRYGVEMDDPMDQVFNPNKHEAVFQTPVSDKEPGTIFVVQKKGYLLKNRVLRPAQVGIVADPPAEN